MSRALSFDRRGNELCNQIETQRVILNTRSRGGREVNSTALQDEFGSTRRRPRGLGLQVPRGRRRPGARYHRAVGRKGGLSQLQVERWGAEPLCRVRPAKADEFKRLGCAWRLGVDRKGRRGNTKVRSSRIKAYGDESGFRMPKNCPVWGEKSSDWKARCRRCLAADCAAQLMGSAPL